MTPGIDPELLEAFLAESGDLLEQSDQILVDLEQQPQKAKALQALLRPYHTLKGAAAAVGLAEVATYLHHGESLLQAVKVGSTKVEAARLTDFFSRFNDSIKAAIAEACGAGDGEGHVLRDVAAAIEALQRPAPPGESGGAAADRGAAAPGAPCDPPSPTKSEPNDGDPAILRVPAARLDALMQRANELLVQRSCLDDTARGFFEVKHKLDASRRRLGQILDTFQERGEQSDLVRSASEASAEARDATQELGNIVRELGLQLRHLSRTSTHLQRQITLLRLVSVDTTIEHAEPMNASIEEVVLVEVGKQAFALPIEFTEQLLLIDAPDLEKLRTGRVYSFRGQQLPVLFLAPLVSEAVAAEGAVVIVLRAMDRAMALVVQRVRSKEEVIVRPLGNGLEAHPFLSGATVSDSGQVIFVVDCARLFDVLAHTAAHSAEPAEEKRPPEDLPARGVLLVDDSKSIRKLGSQFLAAEHFEFETAVDGIDALEKLASSRFDIVVTDLEMPRLHGYELLAAIKRDPRWAHLPVIVCTSRSSEKFRQRARELGADGYITKPFTKDQLCGEVARLAPSRDKV